MKYQPDIHHRRSLRLKDYDYSRPEAYFVTICTMNRECKLCEIIDNKIHFNTICEMVEKWWLRIPEKFPEIIQDKYVIMPNHIHGIIINVGADPCVCPVKIAAPIGWRRADTQVRI